MSRLKYPLLAMVAVMAASCVGTDVIPPSAENRTGVYEAGEPDFDMDALATVSNEQTGVDLYVSIPRASLVFLKQDGGFQAVYEVYALVTRDDGGETIFNEVWTDTLRARTYEETQRFEPLLRRERVDLPAGTYDVEVALEDGNSGAMAERSRRVEVQQLGAGETALSDVLLRIQTPGEASRPIVSINVPSSYDSLHVESELYNVRDPTDVTMTLLRFATDTTIAGLPFWFPPSPFTLEYMGIDYERADTIQTTRRPIRDASDRFTIQFDVPQLDEGTYAAVIASEDGAGRSEKRRYFSVRDPSFPRITSLGEMVDALVYIARDGEMEHIRSAEDTEERRRRFDAFWADRVPNRQAAANLLSAYYERVEQANILFSNHKDGWKTDRGMIYIVFGPPAYIEDRFTRKDWYYLERGALLNRRLPPFIFQRAMTHGLSGLFENYVLRRSEVYEEVWRRKVDDWRDGSVL